MLNSVEDDLAEHSIRTFFSAFGAIRSIVCVHHSHCAFVNFQTRAGAEAAAESCQGKAVIAGCPLRIQWGRPRPLGGGDRPNVPNAGRIVARNEDAAELDAAEKQGPGIMSIAPMLPPGSDSSIVYPSQKPI